MLFRESVLLRWLAAALLAATVVCLVLPAGHATPLRRSRRSSSYLDIQCRGVFNKSVFAKLNNICSDCYELYKDPELQGLCRQDCFGTRYFEGCVVALRLTEEFREISRDVQSLRGISFQ